MSVDAIREAFEAFGKGDLEPVVALIDPAMEWRGRRRLIRFWQPPPSWRGPDEAREVLASVAGGGRSANHDYRLDDIEQHGDRVVISFSWTDDTGRRHRWAQTLRIRDGRIIDIQDYRSPKHANATARLRAAFG
jgi:ketosteroid isomerase-like protein